MPLRDALERLAGSHVTVDVLVPPYPCAGTGALRVLRASHANASVALLTAYEGYERLASERSARR